MLSWAHSLALALFCGAIALPIRTNLGCSNSNNRKLWKIHGKRQQRKRWLCCLCHGRMNVSFCDYRLQYTLWKCHGRGIKKPTKSIHLKRIRDQQRNHIDSLNLTIDFLHRPFQNRVWIIIIFRQHNKSTEKWIQFRFNTSPLISFLLPENPSRREYKHARVYKGYPTSSLL